jgi:nucleoside-diphosphate-sugar epimerase
MNTSCNKAQKFTACVTGATGFVGRAIVDQLLQCGHDVRVLTRKNSGLFSKEVRIFEGDLCGSKFNIGDFLHGCNVLYHCAGQINDASLMEDLHVRGTLMLIDAVILEAEVSSKMIHWIQLSSCGVYGSQDDWGESTRLVTEDTAINPLNAYEMSKLESDLLVTHLIKGDNLKYTIIRPSIIFGINMKNTSLRRMINAVKNRIFFYIGSSGSIATYVHVSDVVNAMLLASSNPKAYNQIYNLSNDCSLESLIDQIAILANVKKPKIRLQKFFIFYIFDLIPAVFRNYFRIPNIRTLTRRTSFSSQKIINDLGYKFYKSMPQSIEELVTNINNKIQ